MPCAKAPVLAWAPKPNPGHSIPGREGLSWMTQELASLLAPCCHSPQLRCLLFWLHQGCLSLASRNALSAVGLQQTDRPTALHPRAGLQPRAAARSWALGPMMPRGGLGSAVPQGHFFLSGGTPGLAMLPVVRAWVHVCLSVLLGSLALLQVQVKGVEGQQGNNRASSPLVAGVQQVGNSSRLKSAAPCRSGSKWKGRPPPQPPPLCSTAPRHRFIQTLAKFILDHISASEWREPPSFRPFGTCVPKQSTHVLS